jgi:hypothetical protein
MLQRRRARGAHYGLSRIALATAFAARGGADFFHQLLRKGACQIGLDLAATGEKNWGHRSSFTGRREPLMLGRLTRESLPPPVRRPAFSLGTRFDTHLNPETNDKDTVLTSRRGRRY